MKNLAILLSFAGTQNLNPHVFCDILRSIKNKKIAFAILVCRAVCGKSEPGSITVRLILAILYYINVISLACTFASNVIYDISLVATDSPATKTFR